MKNRRGFLLTLTAGIVALGVIIAPAIADELLGVITKVDVAGKKLTVEDKDGKEVEVTTTDDTEVPAKGGGTAKIDLEKIATRVSPSPRRRGRRASPSRSPTTRASPRRSSTPARRRPRRMI